MNLGRRGSALTKPFNKGHILAIMQTICFCRRGRQITGRNGTRLSGGVWRDHACLAGVCKKSTTRVLVVRPVSPTRQMLELK
jgi:hypothetical protein